MNTNIKTDLRFLALKRGLNQLTVPQLEKVVEYNQRREMVYDTFNYDAQRKLWCPLAVGIGLPESFKERCVSGDMTDEEAKRIIVEVGSEINGLRFNINPIKGVAGEFFRSRRPEDLEMVCRKLVCEKSTTAFLHN